MFELRDQNSNVSLVYSMIQCVKRSSAYVLRHDLILCWTQEYLDSTLHFNHMWAWENCSLHTEGLTLWILNPFLDFFGASLVGDSRFQSGVIFNPENIFSSGVEVTSHSDAYSTSKLRPWRIILGLNQSHIALNVILEGEVHNCCVDWASRIVKYNVNKGSIACKSLLYEGDCDCRISSSPSLEGKYSEHGS